MIATILFIIIVKVVDGDGDDSVDVPFVPASLKGPKLSESQCQELDTFSEYAKTIFSNKPGLTSTSYYL